MGEPEQSAEQQFLRHLDLIESLLRIVARRYALHDDEPDDFASWVKLKMVEDGYAVLRKFRGEAKLRTYLTTVFVRLAKDWLIARRGKWRPSAQAYRGGVSAIQLEMLISYDGRTMEEAVEVVKRNFGAAESRAELHRLAEELPQHPPRSEVSLEALSERQSHQETDAKALREEQQARSERVSAAVAEALQAMPAGDRLVIQMHYGRGMTVASIARVLDLPQRPLYSRLENLLGRLRRSLESRGVDWQQVRELLGWVEGEVVMDLGLAAGDGLAERRKPPAGEKPPATSVPPAGRSGERRRLR